jgi:hypothetical protein
LQPGDAAAFDFGGDPQHVGLIGNYVHGGLSLIHACSKTGRVIEHRLDDRHMKRLVAAYRLPGVSA